MVTPGQGIILPSGMRGVLANGKSALFNGDGECPECCEEEPPPCTQFEDNFDRSNSSDIGSDWSEESGDWSIASNKLSISSANALCLCDVSLDHPYALEVIVEGSTADDDIHIIFNYVDSDNYTFIRITVNDGSGNRLEIVDRVGGVETMLSDTAHALSTGSPQGVMLCVYDTYVWLETPGENISAHVTVGSSVCGLGTGDTVTGTITFDDFSITTPRSVNPLCDLTPCDEVCSCSDDFDTLPTTHLEVVISGTVNRSPTVCTDCEDFDGTYLLYIERCADPGGATNWLYTFPEDGQPCEATELRVVIVLHNLFVEFFGIDSGTTLAFRIPLGEELPSDTNCNEFDEFDVPPVTGFAEQFFGCDTSGATCTITSIVP